MKLSRNLGILVLLLSSAPALFADAICAGSGAGCVSSFTANYDGFLTTTGPAISGLTAKATFSNFLFSADPSLAGDTDIQFDVNLANNSSSPILTSRVSVMGFDTSPNIDPAGKNSVSPISPSTWPTTVTLSGNMPYQIKTVEFCFSNNNCAGGASGGVTLGTSDGFRVNLAFIGAHVTSLTFDNLYVKYQDVSSTDQSVQSSNGGQAVSFTTTPVPEPNSLLFFGTGLSGAAFMLRRRKSEK